MSQQPNNRDSTPHKIPAPSLDAHLHHINPAAKDVVLLVIDMQKGFLNKRSDHIKAPVLTLVKRWDAAGGSIVFTRFINRPNSQYQRLIGWSRLQSAPETDLADELVPYAKTIIDKNLYTPFGEELDRLVSAHGFSTLVLCGVATDGCVLKTAIDAFERSLLPIVVRDACASHAGDEIHQMGLTLIERFIGRHQVVGMEDIIPS